MLSHPSENLLQCATKQKLNIPPKPRGSQDTKLFGVSKFVTPAAEWYMVYVIWCVLYGEWYMGSISRRSANKHATCNMSRRARQNKAELRTLRMTHDLQRFVISARHFSLFIVRLVKYFYDLLYVSLGSLSRIWGRCRAAFLANQSLARPAKRII